MSEGLNQEVCDFIIKGTGTDTYLSKSERLARKIMVELVKAGRAEFLLLRDDEVSAWWNNLYSGVHQRIEKHKERVYQYNMKLEVYNKLSKEERKVLGIRKPVKPKDL
jgi:hypothetical protein